MKNSLNTRATRRVDGNEYGIHEPGRPAERLRRIHRTNAVGMVARPPGVRPGEYRVTPERSGAGGFDRDDFEAAAREVGVAANAPEGGRKRCSCGVRVHTPGTWEHYPNGGMLPYRLKQLAA